MMNLKIIKIILPVILVIFLMGCELGNTPTSKVEEMLSKYQTLDKDIDEDMDKVLDNYELSEEQRDRYRKILERQYKNLVYDVKKETKDGDMATVEVEIEVMDYKKVIDRVESEYSGSSDYGSSSYIDYKLSELEKAQDKIIYTVNLTCTRDSEGKWQVDNLTNLDMQKIEGMY